MEEDGQPPVAAPLQDDPDSVAFQTALLGEDDLGALVRAHIQMEHDLRKLVEMLVPEPSYLKGAGLRYHHLVALAGALGLDDDLIRPLRQFNKLRNRFAHEIHTKLTAQDETELYQTLSKRLVEIAQGSYERTCRRMGKPILPFPKLEPRDLFVLIAVVIRAGIVAAQLEISRSNAE